MSVCFAEQFPVQELQPDYLGTSCTSFKLQAETYFVGFLLLGMDNSAYHSDGFP